MSALAVVTDLDRDALGAVIELRTGVLTTLMVLASAWWLYGLVIPAIGAAADLRRRPRAVPWSGLLAGAALLVASLGVQLIKALVDRARPPLGDPGVTALVPLPHDASFPSGHAASAFAAAGVVALLHRRLRLPVLALAALVAVSRVYLGVHYPLDVLAGAAVGLTIAWAAVALARAARRRLSRPRPGESPPQRRALTAPPAVHAAGAGRAGPKG